MRDCEERRQKKNKKIGKIDINMDGPRIKYYSIIDFLCRTSIIIFFAFNIDDLFIFFSVLALFHVGNDMTKRISHYSGFLSGINEILTQANEQIKTTQLKNLTEKGGDKGGREEV